jgi:hypothetical protein
MTDVILSAALETLRDLLQRFGYRAEIVADDRGQALVRSATSGMTFDIRAGNRLVDQPAQFLDVSFVALLKVEGELPLAVVNEWNNLRRFGRLHLSQGFLALDMDVAFAGGVAVDHLRAAIAVWDQLLQGLIAYLRAELPRLAAGDGAAAPTAVAAESGPAPIAAPLN